MSTRPEHENTNRIVGGLGPRENSNRHCELGSGSPAVARRKCYCASPLALRRSTAVLVRRRRSHGATRVMLVVPERAAACLGALNIRAPLRLCRRVALAETHSCRAERNFIAVFERDRLICGFLVDESTVGTFKIFDTRLAA